MTDVLALPDEQRDLVSWMMRQGTVALPQVCAAFAWSDAQARTALAALLAGGFLQASEERGQPQYSVRVASRPVRRSGRDLWKALDD